MRNFALWDGATSTQGVAVFAPSQLPPAPEGCEWIELDGDHVDYTVALVDGVITEVPRDQQIDVRRALRWEEARAYRDQRVDGGCITALGRVDTDADSQRKIVGAVTAAMIAKQAGAAFSIDWTMADNSVVTHTADQLISMGMAVTAFLSACQRAGTAIRDAIDAAISADALAAIDITIGYP